MTNYLRFSLIILVIPLLLGGPASRFIEGFFNFAEAQEALPDLAIESATLTSTNLSFTIRNQGSAATGPYRTRIQWIRADNISATGPSYTEYGQSNNLAINGTLPVSVDFAPPNYLATPPADAVKLRITLDPPDLDAVLESNEGNNVVDLVRVTDETTGEDLADIDEEIVIQEIVEELQEEPEEEEVPTEEPAPAKFEPRVLPGNPLYFFKNVWRETKAAFTFDPQKDAELRLRYANEKILEANILADRGKTDRAIKHLQSYTRDTEKIEKFTSKVAEQNKEEAEKLSSKVFRNELRHQVLLGKFERKATVENLDDIKDIRSKTIEHIGQVLVTIGDSQTIEKITETALTPNGSPFKSIRNLEVLKQIEQKVSAEARDAIQEAQANSIGRFKRQLEALPTEHQRLFSGYIEKTGGDEVSYLKVLDDLKQEEIAESTADQILQVKDRLVLRVEDRFKSSIQKDSSLAKTVLQNLAGGTVEDLRIIKTIERVIDPAFKPYLDSVKKDALSGFQKNIGGISLSDQEKFIRETKEYLIAKGPTEFQDVSLSAPDLTAHATFPRSYSNPKNRPVIGVLNRGNADAPFLTAPVNGVRLTWFDSNNTEIKSVVRPVKSLTKCINPSCPASSFDSIDFRDDPDGDFPASTARFRAEVDFAKLIKESNEDNNIEDTVDFKPDFGIGTVALTSPGRKFKVTIINWGDKPSPSLSAGNGIRVSWFAIKPAKQKAGTFDPAASFSAGGGSVVIPLDRALEAGGYGYFEYVDEGSGKNFPDSDFNVVAEVDFGMEVDEELEENNRVEFIHCAKITSPNCLLLGEKLEDLPDSLQSEVLSAVGSGEVSLRPAKHINAGLSSMFARKDIMQMEILEDVRQNLSPQQQKIIEKIKESVAKGITRQLRAVSAENKDAMVRKITDDSPQSLEIIQKTFTDSKVRDILLKKQLENIEKKVEKTEDVKKVERIINELSASETKKIVTQLKPELIGKISQKTELGQILEKLTQQPKTLQRRVDEVYERLFGKTLVAAPSQLSESLERLSSGLRINTAQDDPPGLAVSERMRASIRSLSQASRNAQDGISLLQTAEGAYSEIANIVVRMRELAVQSSSDTLPVTDREQLQTEYQQLVRELDRLDQENASGFKGSVVEDLRIPVSVSGSSVATESNARKSITVVDEDLSNLKDIHLRFRERAKLLFAEYEKEERKMISLLAEVEAHWTKKMPVICSNEYKPVCGADDKTYSNRCVAESQNRVKVVYEGECKIVPEPVKPPAPQCSDGIDNDKDGYIDLKDPGCTDAQDNDETDVVVSPPPQCSDGIDNDKDGYVDLKDPGCVDSKDDDETDVVTPPPPAPQCSDGIDNDKDGYIDLKDPGCTDNQDNDETNVVSSPPPSTTVKPTISSFVANPTAITKGQSSTLSWGVSDATSIILGPTKETLTASGKKVVAPTFTTTYTITATNAAGSVNASVTITVYLPVKSIL